MAKCKAFYVLAWTGSEQQGLRRQNALVTNTPIWRPGCSSSAPCCRHSRTHRHRPRRLLQATLVPHRKGQGGDRYGPQGRSPVLQRRASRNGVHRSWGLVLRDALSHASRQQSASTCQGIRVRSPALGAEGWCYRFLGIVLQRQLADLGVQRLHIDRRRLRSIAAGGTENISSPPSSCAFHEVIWFGCTSNCSASCAMVRSPLMAASATFALKDAVWFRRGRLVMVTPDSQA